MTVPALPADGIAAFTGESIKMRIRTSGFTLLELMITLVIVAILAAVAIPSYQQYVTKARRTDATTALLQLAAAQEKYFLSNNQYATSMVLLGIPATSPSGDYYLSTDGAGVFATATSGGRQANDAECMYFRITLATGLKQSQKDDLSFNTAPDPCWG